MKKFVKILMFVMVMLCFAPSEVYAQSDTTYASSVSPNPFEDQINLTIQKGNKKPHFIKIQDAIGMEVFSMVVGGYFYENESVISLSLASLKPGLYFLSIYNDKGLLIETKRIFRSYR